MSLALALMASESHMHPSSLLRRRRPLPPQVSGFALAGRYAGEREIPDFTPHVQFALFSFLSSSCCISQLTVNHISAHSRLVFMQVDDSVLGMKDYLLELFACLAYQ